MKKYFFICLLFFFAAGAIQAQSTYPEITAASFAGKFSKVATQTDKRILYAVNMNEFQTEAQKSAFVNHLYKSAKIAVVSRINENGILIVSAASTISNAEIEQELEALRALPTEDSAPTKY